MFNTSLLSSSVAKQSINQSIARQHTWYVQQGLLRVEKQTNKQTKIIARIPGQDQPHWESREFSMARGSCFYTMAVFIEIEP